MPVITDLPPAPAPAPDTTPHVRPPFHPSTWLPLIGLSLFFLALGIATGVLPMPQQAFTLVGPLPGQGLFGSIATPETQPALPYPSPYTGAGDSIAAVSACTGNSRTVFGRNVDVGQGEWLCGSVTDFGGAATVEGRVGGNVTDVGGSITIAGRVDGDVTAVGGDVTLQSGAEVAGNVHAFGGSVHRDAGAAVSGTVVQGIGMPDLPPPLQWLSFSGSYTLPWGHLLFWGLAGAAVATVFPRQLRQVRWVAAHHIGGSLIMGILGWVVGGILAGVLFVTCLGIPLAVLLLAALWLASAGGTIAFGLWLGELLLGRARSERASPVLATVVGVSLIVLAKSIPAAGGVITALMWCLGLGAALLALLASRRSAYSVARVPSR